MYANEEDYNYLINLIKAPDNKTKDIACHRNWGSLER